MVNHTLYFKLGDGEITLSDLSSTIQHISGVLQDLDVAAANDLRGALRWRVSVLEKKSPPLLGVTAEPIARLDPQTRKMVRRDTSLAVEKLLLESVRALDSGENPQGMPTDTIRKIYKLAAGSKRIGNIEVYSDADASVEISETTLAGINKVLGSTSQSKGSILGKLEAITVHDVNEIRVWDENTNIAVRCQYPDGFEENIKNLLRKRVLVGGMVTFNAIGQAVSVRVESITSYRSDDTLPTIEEVSGLLKEPTDEKFTLAEYMEHLRDG